MFGILFGAWLVSTYSKIMTRDGKGQLTADGLVISQLSVSIAASQMMIENDNEDINNI